MATTFVDLQRIGVDFRLTSNPATFRQLDRGDLWNRLEQVDDMSLQVLVLPPTTALDRGCQDVEHAHALPRGCRCTPAPHGGCKCFVQHRTHSPSFFEVGGQTYRIHSHVGNGTFGMVGACIRESDDNIFAVKRITCPEPRDRITVMKEIVIQVFVASLGHAPAIERVGRGHGNTANDIYIVMEHLSGRDTWAWIHDFKTVEERNAAFHSAIRGLAQMSQKLYGICEFTHGDMKPDNLFRRTSGEIILIDFGFASVSFGPGLEIVSLPELASARQPTRDLTMFTVWYALSDAAQLKKDRFINGILRNAVCDTVTSGYLCGGLLAHEPHSLVAKPGTRYAQNPHAWPTLYVEMGRHNNVKATPENVLRLLGET